MNKASAVVLGVTMGTPFRDYARMAGMPIDDMMIDGKRT